MKLKRKEDLNVCFIWGDRKNKTGWDIFEFSETAETKSTKLDKTQELNVLYQVWAFRGDGKNKMAARSLIGWYIFDFS